MDQRTNHPSYRTSGTIDRLRAIAAERKTGITITGETAGPYRIEYPDGTVEDDVEYAAAAARIRQW